MCLEQEQQEQNSDPRTQTHKLKKKILKTKNTIPDPRTKKEKTPTYTHFPSFAQTHSKK